LEYNFFGTAEFVEFCRAVGCEPMICVNAGDGTPDGAAAWVEYCNGSGDTPMGRLRAEHGFPEPFGIRYWEVGNELFGRWQVSWSTPGGHVDRYRQFAQAMLGADATVLLLACGYPWWEADAWDSAAIADLGPDLRCLTDHILTGGDVNAATDPAELYHAFVGQAVDIGRRYRAVAARMQAAGVAEPHLAITELQLFSHFQATPAYENAPADALSPATMPAPATISEALYFTTIFHECVRMEGLVEMITHSATVNHGGGLRKTHERVWANPVHHAHTLLAPLDGAIPVALNVESATFSTKTAFVNMPPLTDVPAVDALAALSEDGSSLIVTLAHRAAHTGPITVALDFGDFPAADKVEAMIVAGESMSDQNTPAEPERIAPQRSQITLTNGQGKITLPPYSFTRLTVQRAGAAAF
jgi:alpha-N-arabinofuranosidase